MRDDYDKCHHTKYLGCRPCEHDIKARQREALRLLTEQAQEMGLYEATDGPPPVTR